MAAKGALATNPSTNSGTHKNASGQWVNNAGQRVDGYGRVISTNPSTGRNSNAPGANRRQGSLVPVSKFIQQDPKEQLKTLGTGAGAIGEKAMIGGLQYDPNNPMDNWNPQFAQYADKAQQAVMNQFNRSMEPQFGREDADFQQCMAEQGIDPNSGRYKAEYQNLQQSHDMQRQNAMDQAYQTGLAAQQQAFNQNQQAQMTPFQFAQATNPYWQIPYETQAEILRQQMAGKTSIGVANIGANASMFGSAVDAMSRNPYTPYPSTTNSILQGLGSTLPYWFQGS